MQADRFIGAAWASVHGPAEPRALLLFCLKLRFRGLCAAPAPRVLDWQGVTEERARLPFQVAAVRVAGILETDRRADHGLASGSGGDLQLAFARIDEAVQLARLLACPQVILEPGAIKPSGEQGPVDLGDPSTRWTRDTTHAQLARRNAHLNRGLDAACRALHQVLKRWPEITFCLTGSRHVFGLGEPKALGFIFEDQKSQRLRYWHDAAIAARREQLTDVEQGSWLEAFADRMAGISVADSADGLLYLPPGAGLVDHALLASYRQRLGRGQPIVVELDPSVDAKEMPGVHAFLDKHGL